MLQAQAQKNLSASSFPPALPPSLPVSFFSLKQGMLNRHLLQSERSTLFSSEASHLAIQLGGEKFLQAPLFPLPTAFPGSDQSEANRGGSPGEESSRGSTISIHTQLRPQTRVRARPRMGGKDCRMSPMLNAFTIVCHHPGAGPSA